jgi:ABC-type transporter Mla MlaB component
VIKEYMRDPAGKNNLRAWVMLFDFYQLTHNRKEFDALSMLFTVKFERSPPVWADSDESGDPRRKEKRERKDFFAFKPAADNALLSEIDRLEAFVKEMGSARLDFAKVKGMLAEEAELLAIVMQRIRRAKMPLWFNGFNDFAGLLKKLINETAGERSQGYWSLLFELYILDGKLNEYEELGLEYAVAFEMSPPAWEAVVRPTGDAPAGASAAPEPASAGFALRGVFSSTSKDMLTQLAAYAAARQEVVVDMSGLLRIDFNAAAQFFEAIRMIHVAQKRVILQNLNELVAALLEVFAVNKHAILMRKKAS